MLNKWTKYKTVMDNSNDNSNSDKLLLYNQRDLLEINSNFYANRHYIVNAKDLTYNEG